MNPARMDVSGCCSAFFRLTLTVGLLTSPLLGGLVTHDTMESQRFTNGSPAGNWVKGSASYWKNYTSGGGIFGASNANLGARAISLNPEPANAWIYRNTGQAYAPNTTFHVRIDNGIVDLDHCCRHRFSPMMDRSIPYKKSDNPIMKTHTTLTILLLAFAAFPAHELPAEDVPAAPAKETVQSLKAGDPAPEFIVTQWLKGDPIALDDKGTYIVECWATWCGPCIAAFPHLSEIAKVHKDKISVIGVNVWERKKPDEVKAFVAAQGDKMSYLVAADGDGVIANRWLKAAGRNGIPCAFVVSKGNVAWIGHPAGLKQDLLESILKGTFDPKALAKGQDQEAAAATYYGQHVMPHIRKNDTAKAIEALEEMKRKFPDRVKYINPRIERLKLQTSK